MHQTIVLNQPLVGVCILIPPLLKSQFLQSLFQTMVTTITRPAGTPCANTNSVVGREAEARQVRHLGASTAIYRDYEEVQFPTT